MMQWNWRSESQPGTFSSDEPICALPTEAVGILQTSSSPDSVTKDWRKSLGMFDDHPVMKQVDEAGKLIRQQDREQGAA